MHQSRAPSRLGKKELLLTKLWSPGIRGTVHSGNISNKVFSPLATDLRGYPVRITTFGHPPKIHEMIKKDKFVFTGYEINMMNILGKTLNFEPSFRKPITGKKWGAFFDQNKTYDGLKGISLVHNFG